MKYTLFITASLLGLIGLTGCGITTRSNQAMAPAPALSSWPAATGLVVFERSDRIEPVQLPELTAASTLDDYIRYAALNNPALRARFMEFKASTERIVQAGVLPDPQLNFEFAFDSGNARLGLMQMFPWFGTLPARTDAAAARAQAAGLQFEAAGLALFERVTNAFAEYVYLARSIEVAQANLELLGEFEKAALTLFEAGRASYADVVRAQLELAILDDTLSGLEQFRPALAARLNAVLHREPEATLQWPRPAQPDLEQLESQYVLSALRQNNPDLAARQRRIAAAEHEITLAQKRFLPNLGFGLEWMHAGEQSMGGSSNDVMLMFTMNLPLWRDSYRAGERQAKAQAEGERRDLADAENQLLAQAQSALYELNDSRRQLTLYREVLLDMARELVAASEAAYQENRMNFLSLIDAQRQLLRYQLNDARAAADYLQARARLVQLTGGDLKLNEAAAE